MYSGYFSSLPVTSSGSLDETREIVSSLFCSHTLRKEQRDPGLYYWHKRMKLDQFSLVEMSYGADVAIEPGELEKFYLIQIPLNGHAEISCGGRTVTSTPQHASIPNPARSLKMRWSSDCRKLVLKIERAKLEQHLSNLLGSPISRSIDFDLDLDLTSVNGASWKRSLGFLLESIKHNPDLVKHPFMVKEMEQLVMTSLLHMQPHNYSDSLHSRTCAVAPRHVKLAEEFILENAASPITIETLIDVTGAKANQLFSGFRQFRGTTPMRFLASVRLDRAHRDLMKATADDTVTEIATKWGFTQLGRFSVVYRKRYGISPSETLRA
ncbi:AraC family transcriptional regulator [Emcibacter nanhaiensis]|uniref:AraC family transcriptional regulator n=1 Tax=Emcibacter nanhaiensis TaxID=1505037 RepID=A0A501PJH4_9PROT|nr:AraC family transcriptional regulator [Emcibacter nanhaiensis]TPD60182.1 AraC family transcriptional regulator [Emcibacter nanhaiensis]